jgi:dihydrofolate reductase
MPLPNRINIVVTRTPEKYTCYPKYSQLDNIFFWNESTVLSFLANPDLANKFLIKAEKEKEQDKEQEKYKKIFVIGGQQIYNLLMPFCSGLFLTKIKSDYNCDLHLSCLDTIGSDNDCKIYYEDEELQITHLSL